MPLNKDAPLLSAAELMPSSNHDVVILHQRAELFASLKPQDENDTHFIPYIYFGLGKLEKYGIPYEYAKEVMPHVTLTHVPRLPKFIAGVINRRSSLVTVIDLRELFNIHASNNTIPPCVIIVSAHGLNVGILIDTIFGSNQYNQATLVSSLQFENVIKSEFVIGLDKGTITILNIEPILLYCQQQLTQHFS